MPELDLAPEPASAPVAPAPTLTNPTGPVTPLSQVWREGMAKREAAKAGDAAPEPKAAPAKTDAKAAEPKSAPAAKPAKGASPLDTILGDAAPAPKKEDAAPAAPEDVPANAPVKQLRAAYEHQRAEAARWKAEAEKSAAPKPELHGQLETLTKEREAWLAERAKLRDAITALNVEYDPEFQTKFVAGRRELVGRAAEKLTAFGGDGTALAEALALPDGKLRSQGIKDAVADLDDIDRAKMIGLIDRVETLDEEAAALRKDPQQAWEKMTKGQEEAAQRQQAETTQLKAKEFDRVTKDLEASFFMLRKLDDGAEGAADWNKGREEGIAKAQHLLGPKASYAEVSEAAIKAAFVDRMQALLMEERGRRIAAEKEVAGYRKAEPGYRGTANGELKDDPLTKSVGQVYREGMARRRGETV